jgi:hypothetical protein
VRQLMPGQDLTRVTIPAFFLEPRSLLERMADTQMHPDLLLNMSHLEDPVERMRAVTRWYLSGWHYKTLGVKKPYNPIIGETFACYWQHADGTRSQYFAEQVLHRPPVSAIYFENRAHNMVASAHIWTRSQFSAPQTTKSILDGECVLTLTNLDETYYITFPSACAPDSRMHACSPQRHASLRTRTAGLGWRSSAAPTRVAHHTLHGLLPYACALQRTTRTTCWSARCAWSWATRRTSCVARPACGPTLALRRRPCSAPGTG